MKSSNNKRPSNTNRPARRDGRDGREARVGDPRRQDYFERRFMTDEEHEKFRQHLIEVGIVKTNEPPTYLTKEQSAELREKMIANGTLIPRAQRAASGNVAGRPRAGKA